MMLKHFCNYCLKIDYFRRCCAAAVFFWWIDYYFKFPRPHSTESGFIQHHYFFLKSYFYFQYYKILCLYYEYYHSAYKGYLREYCYYYNYYLKFVVVHSYFQVDLNYDFVTDCFQKFCLLVFQMNWSFEILNCDC